MIDRCRIFWNLWRNWHYPIGYAWWWAGELTRYKRTGKRPWL